jgi:hypothetical protein
MGEFRGCLFGLSLLACGLAAPAAALAQSVGTGTNPTSPSGIGQTTNPGPSLRSPGNSTDAGSSRGSQTASLSPLGDSCASGAPSLPLWNAGDVADNIKAMSKATKYYLENCHCPDTGCVADALDNYAAALEALGPRLPPAVADLPMIVRRAARKVRAARSISQARAAIGEAEHVIQAKLQLLEVADPDARSDSIRSARFTGDVLSVADVSLVRVAGL